MSQKITEWRLKMTGNVDAMMSKFGSSADKLSGKFGSLQNKISSTKFQNFASQVPILNNGMNLMGNSAMLAGAGIAVVGTALFKSAKLSMEYEKGMAKINATTQSTAPELAKMKAELMAIGESSGGNFERIPQAYEKINSVLNDASVSMSVLKIANKGAQAGFVDIDVAAGALAQTMSILGKQGNASDIMDTMLGAKKAGAAEFQDFANYLPSLIASGKNLGMAYKDIAGSFSFLTTNFSGADSAMYMQNVMTALGKSAITGKDGLAGKGINVFNKDGSIRDLDAIMGDLSSKMKNMTDKQKSAFLESVGLKDSQAKIGFSAFIAGAEKHKKIVGEVKNSVGELQRAYEATANTARTWGDISDQIKSWGVSIGDFVLPVVDKLVTSITASGRAMKQFFSGSMFEKRKFQGYDDEEALNFKKQNAAQVAMREAKRSFATKYGEAALSGGNFNTEQRAFYDSKYNKGFADIMGIEYKQKHIPKDAAKKVEGIFDDPEEKASKKGKSSNSHIKSGIDGISGGGKMVRNVTVNFNKALIEKFEIKAATVKESGAELVRNIEDLLLRAVNGAELSLTNE